MFYERKWKCSIKKEKKKKQKKDKKECEFEYKSSSNFGVSISTYNEIESHESSVFISFDYKLSLIICSSHELYIVATYCIVIEFFN